MPPFHILHLEDSATDIQLIQHKLVQAGLSLDFSIAKTGAEYRDWLTQTPFDLILSDSGVPGFSGQAAWDLAHQKHSNTPFVFVSNHVDESKATTLMQQGVKDCIRKDQLWRLKILVQRLAKTQNQSNIPARHLPTPSNAQENPLSHKEIERYNLATEKLITVVQKLSMASDLDAVTAIVRHAARELTGADGATFVLKEGDQCYYADEDAISPLWKGQRFPKEICIGGWCMDNKQQVVIEDVFEDVRIPYAAYKPTFIKSLVMVPVCTENPIGAIGNYWATPHRATPEEIQLIQSLADTTAVALKNIQVNAELEQFVQARTVHLQHANQDLESFAYTLSHDLRSPLTVIKGFSNILLKKYGNQLEPLAKEGLRKIDAHATRMNEQIDELLGLYNLGQQELQSDPVNLSELAKTTLSNLGTLHPNSQTQWHIEEHLTVQGDTLLLKTVLENLLSNAWKYSSKNPQAKITVGSIVNSASQTDGEGVFFIEDNGAGFDMTYAKKLFQPFQRLHSQDEFEGTGVGLASVHRIIQRHGGKIWAESTVNQGATFYFTLPLAKLETA